jgi:hypothetical protein
MNVEQIAEVAHETNRAFCNVAGDNSQPAWKEAPEWQRSSAINGVQFHIDAHKRGETPAPSASHDNWLAEKVAAGWKFGAIKDPEKKEHPCCVPYDELPAEQKVKDYLFGSVVSSFIQAGLVT